MTKKKLTPRQRCAIANPLGGDKKEFHARFHKRNGNLQSVLVFHMFVGDDVPTQLVGRADDDGRAAVWHAFIGQHPEKPIDKWSSNDKRRARTTVMGLVAKVGEGEARSSAGSDGDTIHVYKLATIEEIAMAVRGGEGRKVIKR